MAFAGSAASGLPLPVPGFAELRERLSGALAPPAGATRRPATCEAPRQRWWLVPAVVITILTFFVLTYYPVARVQYREARARDRLAAELSALQARNDRLRAEVNRLQTPEGVEDYARSQLGLVKRGEHVVVVVDGSSEAASMPAAATPVIDSDADLKPPVGAWTAFLDMVFALE